MVGSPSALRDALTNLVFNALDAMPDGGTIVLSARQAGERILLEVVDSGFGMSPEVKDRVFEPFFTTKGTQGTGLGLAMVFGIVERHHGQVDITSEPGRGTTIHLNFPMANGLDLPASDEADETQIQKLRILLVDDDQRLATLAATMLRSDGHMTVTTNSGEAALERLARESFDLVISDVSMGDGMNGWELAAEVRRRSAAIPIVLATGWGAAIDEDEAEAHGVQAVMAKPYRLADFRSMLRQLFPAVPVAVPAEPCPYRQSSSAPASLLDR